MRAPAWLVGVGMAVAFAAAGGAAVGCGGGTPAKFGNIKAGELPAGETWVGVYYNPVYGYLHWSSDGDNVVGRWKRTDSSHWGELSGTVEGNVLHFTWKEHQYGAVGPSADIKGSGVFVYKMGGRAARTLPELDGQYALDDSEQRRRVALREAAEHEARHQLDQRREPDRADQLGRQLALATVEGSRGSPRAPHPGARLHRLASRSPAAPSGIQESGCHRLASHPGVRLPSSGFPSGSPAAPVWLPVRESRRIG